MSDDALSGRGAGLNRHLSDEQMNAFLDDRLTLEERGLAAEHLAACATCQQTLDQLLVLSSTLGNLTQHPVPRSFQLTTEMAGSGQSIWQRMSSFLIPMLPVMRTATMVLVLALGGITLARIAQDDPGNSSTLVPESAMVNSQSDAPTATIAAVGENPTQADLPALESESIQIDPAPTTSVDNGSNEEDRDAQPVGSDGEDSFSQDESSGADNASITSASDDSAAGDVAMESAPMAAEDEEPVDETGESASDVSMMKAPEGTPATPAASPSPIAGTPSPVPAASPDTLVATGAPIEDDDFAWPWTAIQILLVGLIGLLAVAMVVASRGKRMFGA